MLAKPKQSRILWQSMVSSEYSCPYAISNKIRLSPLSIHCFVSSLNAEMSLSLIKLPRGVRLSFRQRSICYQSHIDFVTKQNQCRLECTLHSPLSNVKNISREELVANLPSTRNIPTSDVVAQLLFYKSLLSRVF